ncbi:hypothetical protein CAAN1_03S05798 [[Candida] anglica]|uniref:Peptidyl-prolyl cis-trans isomerase n=1 Tax=[Candida] anglica TaxID=148631 RepID=A0ABP0EHK3_9ASCO
MSVLIETTAGNITLDLFVESQPLPCFNFLKLCKLNYYFFTPFHTIDKDFSVHCGNPNYPNPPNIISSSIIEDTQFQDQSLSPYLLAPKSTIKPTLGTFSFVKSIHENQQVFDSRFIITLSDSFDDSLENQVIPFGQIIEGFTVLETINNTPIESIELKRPLRDIRITYIHILHDPFPDPNNFHPYPLEPSEFQLSTMRFPELSKTTKDINSDNNNEYNALTLELVGDLPHYSIKPSPETLFVAKLNPITTSESLEIVFGRFGNVKNVNIILEPKTKKSLCYGFVEYNEQHEAESAYRKLSKGCVIDGRKLHIDFSQSVR